MRKAPTIPTTAPLLALTLTVALLGGTALGAPLSSPVDGQSESARPERFRKRILYLTDGRALRVRARAADGGWEVEREGQRQLVPADQVRRVRPESEVVAELKAKQRRLSRGTTPEELQERAEVAAWSANNGLVAEALRDTDKILMANPDQALALRVLDELPATFRMPKIDASSSEEAVEAFLRAASKSSASLRELGARELARSGARDAGSLSAALTQGLVHPLRDRRRFSALAARRLWAEELPDRAALAMALIRRAAYDRDMDVREEAARALRDAREEALVEPLVRALESDSMGLRRNAAEALGIAGYPGAVPALVTSLSARPAGSGGGSRHGPIANVFVGRHVAYVRDIDLEIAQGASIGKPVVGAIQDAAVFEARSGGVSGVTFAHVRRAGHRALERLTGEETKDWEAWLEARESAR